MTLEYSPNVTGEKNNVIIDYITFPNVTKDICISYTLTYSGFQLIP